MCHRGVADLSAAVGPSGASYRRVHRATARPSFSNDAWQGRPPHAIEGLSSRCQALDPLATQVAGDHVGPVLRCRVRPPAQGAVPISLKIRRAESSVAAGGRSRHEELRTVSKQGMVPIPTAGRLDTPASSSTRCSGLPTPRWLVLPSTSSNPHEVPISPRALACAGGVWPLRHPGHPRAWGWRAI